LGLFLTGGECGADAMTLAIGALIIRHFAMSDGHPKKVGA